MMRLRPQNLTIANRARAVALVTGRLPSFAIRFGDGHALGFLAALPGEDVSISADEPSDGGVFSPDTGLPPSEVPEVSTAEAIAAGLAIDAAADAAAVAAAAFASTPAGAVEAAKEAFLKAELALTAAQARAKKAADLLALNPTSTTLQGALDRANLVVLAAQKMVDDARRLFILALAAKAAADKAAALAVPPTPEPSQALQTIPGQTPTPPVAPPMTKTQAAVDAAAKAAADAKAALLAAADKLAADRAAQAADLKRIADEAARDRARADAELASLRRDLESARTEAERSRVADQLRAAQAAKQAVNAKAEEKALDVVAQGRPRIPRWVWWAGGAAVVGWWLSRR